MDLGKLSEVMNRESNDLVNLRVAAQLALEDLGAPTSNKEIDKVGTWLIRFAEDARDARRYALHFGVQRSIAIARSHYVDINLEELSQGFVPDYEDAELDKIEEEVAPLARTLAEKMEDEVIPTK